MNSSVTAPVIKEIQIEMTEIIINYFKNINTLPSMIVNLLKSSDKIKKAVR